MRALVAVAVLSCVSASARAGDADAKRQARTHFKQGDLDLQTGAYAAALDEFSEAYRLFPDERLHFNIAQAHRLKGDREQAIEHYRKFLAARAEGEDADAARSYIALLTSELEREAAVRAAAEAARAEAAERAAAAEREAAAAATRAAVAAVVAAPTAPPPKPLVKRPWLWATVGSAAVLIAVGVTVGVVVGGSDRFPSPSLTAVPGDR
jgi:iron complex outermembrane receptor protein